MRYCLQLQLLLRLFSTRIDFVGRTIGENTNQCKIQTTPDTHRCFSRMRIASSSFSFNVFGPDPGADLAAFFFAVFSRAISLALPPKTRKLTKAYVNTTQRTSHIFETSEQRAGGERSFRVTPRSDCEHQPRTTHMHAFPSRSDQIKSQVSGASDLATVHLSSFFSAVDICTDKN
jgi:hypothetical protein